MEIKFIDRATGKTISEKPPAEGLMRFLYHHPFGKTAILPFARRKKISELYGKRMDRASSKKKIKGFVEKLDIDMSESLRAIDEFTSFNDFFARKLKPQARPIGKGFISPGDGKLIAFQNLEQVSSFFVKGQRFTLEKFLKDSDLAARYHDGLMLILRLAPNDYHRFHFPYDGIASPLEEIEGSYYSVSPIALSKHFSKVFTENKRSYCLLTTEDIGQICLAPVGATMVGSIHTTYEAGSQIQKGDEMGYFSFGGSSVLILIEKNRIKIDEDILSNTRNKMETFVKMGESIGTSSI